MSRLIRCENSRQVERRAVRRLVLLPAAAGLMLGVAWAPAAHAARVTMHDLRGDSAQTVALKVGNALANDPDRPADLVKQRIGSSDRCLITDVTVDLIECSTSLALTPARHGDGFTLTVEAFGERALFRAAETSAV